MFEILIKIVDGIEVRQVPDFPNYWISSHGAVWVDPWIAHRNKKRGNTWAPIKPDSRGRPTVFVVNSIFSGKKYIHQLVAICWIGAAPIDKPFVLHRNDICKDNCVLNLRYGTQEENGTDGRKNKRYARGKYNGSGKLDDEEARDVKARALAGENVKSLAEEYFVSSQLVYAIKNGTGRPYLEEFESVND